MDATALCLGMVMKLKTTHRKRCTQNKLKEFFATLLKYILLTPLVFTGAVSFSSSSGFRPLSQKEKRVLRRYFGDCIDNPQIRVHSASWIRQGSGLSLGGSIFLNPSNFEGGVTSGELKLADRYVARIVAHETMHVVQVSWGYFVVASGAALIVRDTFLRTNRYEYRSSTDPTQNLENFRHNTAEQQGEQMADIVFGSSKAGDFTKILDYIKERCMCKSNSGLK
jgi:hypothetical protein